ncbi:ADP-ribose pyrophosphatase [Sphingomonas sp. BE270]|jgi:ADP-ribose pyrophosphatase|uniref:NUDIX hydrolase n=1 Tax=unclassified Sphingomonas TaxID=196159 RepID=UPI00053EC5DE|nr:MULTISPECIES: NUDIX hydrolase [unclassified Sphingomonas]MDR6846900.1 ADP-ribose pyrophosphatase [Sphingomonas sp. BE137]MDR7256578.1 ADP-ribose pyrophosphatase [Sphingomonas sp. BE270]
MSAEIVWEGKYIKVVKDGTWEYVSRARGIQAAVILAVEDGHVLLVEQYRVPLGRRCLELPAGLVGDEEAGESIEASAARELEEETGYRPAKIEQLGLFHSSPGMVSEGFTLVRATGLERVADGGGIDGENITVLRVPVAEIANVVAAKRAEGVAIDVKLLLLLGAGMLAG